MKKHIASAAHKAWTQSYPLFEPATEAERRDTAKGLEAFRALHPDTRMFPDPFLTPHPMPAPARLDELKIVAGPDPLSRKGAESAARVVERRFGIALPIVSSAPSDPRQCLGDTAPLLLSGGAEMNPVALELAKKYHLGVFDGTVPGPGGWGVTVYPELDPGMAPRYVLAFDETTLEQAVQAWAEQAVSRAEPFNLQWAHCVSPGRDWPDMCRDFDPWLAGRAQSAFAFEAVRAWVDSGFQRPYRKVLNEVLLQDFGDGVMANHMVIDLGVDGIRYYQRTGDLRGLELFREMLWGFWDYLNSEAPSVYPSDLDFRAGAVCRYWSWIATHPSITAEERAVFPKLLLGMMRMVHDYFLHGWKYRHAGEGETVRHNHQTFPALALAHAARYFRHWDLPETTLWQEDAAYIFEPIDPTQFKYSENAYFYEVFVPKHFLAWHETADRPLAPAFRDALCRFAKRQWTMLDNFHVSVDYGDTHVHMQPRRPFAVTPWLLPEHPEHREIIEREETHAGAFPPEDPAAFEPLVGLSPRVGKARPAADRGWERMPVDRAFARRKGFRGPPERHFDKLAWRSGWDAHDLYVAVEGIGATGISHGHHETNGILRLNFGGRLWLVSNGYGKPIGEQKAGAAFSGRQLGPVDHNMLVIEPNKDSGVVVPPVNALELDRGETPLPYLVSEVPGYAGCLWRRHLFLLGTCGAVIVDRLTVENGDALPGTVRLEWNIPGEAVPTPCGARIGQRGVTAELHAFGTPCTWAVNGSATWDQVLRSGAYEHACAPLKKAMLTPSASTGKELLAVTGLWLEKTVCQADWDASDRHLCLELQRPLAAGKSSTESSWGTMDFDGKRLCVRLSSS